MEICISGHYYEPELFKQLAQVKAKYSTAILVEYRHAQDTGKQIKSIVEPSGIEIVKYPFRGLEFGRYDFYIKNMWGGDSVLFMHDDVRIHDIAFFDRVAALKHDQAFIFENIDEGICMQNFHGRAIFCSNSFIKMALAYKCTCNQARDRVDRHHNLGTIQPGTGPHKGFWFDPFNDCNHNRGKPPIGIRHYNDEIYHFVWFGKGLASGKLPGLETLKMNTDVKAYFPEFEHARRGKFKVKNANNI